MERDKNIGDCHGNVVLATAYWRSTQIKKLVVFTQTYILRTFIMERV